MKQSQQTERIADTIKKKTKFIDYEKIQFSPKSDFDLFIHPFF